MTDTLLKQDQERKMRNQMKRKLESAREFVLALSSIFLWDKPWFPGIIIGTITSIFLFLWYWGPSALTIVSLILMTDVVMEYCVPLVCNAIKPPECWTASKEKKFEDVCDSLTKTQQAVSDLKIYVSNLRTSYPAKYISIVIPSLALLAWIGSVCSTLVLTYFIVLALALYPGIKHKRLIEKLAALFFGKVSESLKAMKKEK